MRIVLWLLVGSIGALGCGPAVEVPGDDAGDEDLGGEDSGGGETTGSSIPSPDPSTTGNGTTTTTTSGPAPDTGADEDTGCLFLCEPDGGGDLLECDTWEQDCPAGEKCMPWANDGGNSWNATRCSPIVDAPGQLGDPCVVEGSGVSGIDTCDLGLMCWDVNPDTLEGHCIAMCTGSQEVPKCDDACSTCNINGDGVLNLCLPDCDPTEPEPCGEGLGCYVWGQRFQCAPDASGRGGAAGSPCEFSNGCDAGLQCVNGGRVPGCEASRCCTPSCDAADGDACDALAGTSCIPFELEDPGCYATTPGVCLAPATANSETQQ